MIPYVPSTYQAVFYGLIGVWALAYIVGLIVGKTSVDRTRRIPLWTKLVMIAVVVAIGGIEWLVFAANTGAEAYARWIFLGLAAGALGDLILAEVLPIKKAFLIGMGVFAIGHIFYLMAIFVLRKILYPSGMFEIVAIVLGSLFLAALLWEFVVRDPFGNRTVNRAAFFYTILLVIATAFALYFALRSQIMILLGAGITLFLISDGLLSQAAIKKRGFPHIHDIVWILYSAGQLLIALSIGEAIHLVG
jgi:uncharacterized membrane protein YhhN